MIKNKGIKADNMVKKLMELLVKRVKTISKHLWHLRCENISRKLAHYTVLSGEASTNHENEETKHRHKSMDKNNGL